MHEIISLAAQNVLRIVVIAAIVVTAKYLLPWLGNAIKVRLIDRFVDAAEQKIKGSGLGTQKKSQVVEWLTQAHIRADAVVDALIEASVFRLNSAGKAIRLEQLPTDADQ